MRFLLASLLLVTFASAQSVNLTVPASTQPTVVTITVSVAVAQPVVSVPATTIPSTLPTTVPSTLPTTIPTTLPTTIPATLPAPKMAMGTNVSANDPWSTTAMWCDVTHQMTGWYGAEGGTVTSYDPNGYPVAITNGSAWSHCWLYGYPSGIYHVTWKGPQNAIFVVNKSLQNVKAENGGWGADVQFATGDWCVLKTTTGGISDVHILSPDAKPGQVFRDAYLNILKPYSVVRMMTLARVNGNSRQPLGPQKWTDRVQPQHWDQTTREIALEYQAELCRESGTIPWVNLYYGGDDDSIAKTAAIFKDFPCVFMELGNEFWNTANGYQGNLIRQDAAAAGIYGSGDVNQLGARRDAALTAHAGQVFRQTVPKVKVVLSGQATWNAWANDALTYAKPGDIDCLAIAPYTQTLDAATTVPAILASMDKWTTNALVPNIAANNQVAKRYGATLIAYEGGQHLFASTPLAPNVGPQANTAEATAFNADPFTLAQADPGMGLVYDHLFDAARNNGITLFCHFMAVSSWDKHGYWGSIQQTGDPDNAKSLAIKRAMK